MRKCVFIHMYVPTSITAFVFMPVSSSSPAILTLASAYVVEMGEILTRQEMRNGVNEGGGGSSLLKEDEGVNIVMQGA